MSVVAVATQTKQLLLFAVLNKYFLYDKIIQNPLLHKKWAHLSFSNKQVLHLGVNKCYIDFTKLLCLGSLLMTGRWRRIGSPCVSGKAMCCWCKSQIHDIHNLQMMSLLQNFHLDQMETEGSHPHEQNSQKNNLVVSTMSPNWLYLYDIMSIYICHLSFCTVHGVHSWWRLSRPKRSIHNSSNATPIAPITA